jgi:ferredoxin-NADP reductase
MFSELAVGSRVWLKLPYGTFCPSTDATGSIVLIAGGSGITPFISFLEWAAVERPSASVELHYGARNSHHLIYRGAIDEIRLKGLGNLRVIYYIEQASEQDGGIPAIVHGRLSAERIWANQIEPKNSRFYLSGPKVMIDDFRRQLVELGASPESVLSDDWA